MPSLSDTLATPSRVGVGRWPWVGRFKTHLALSAFVMIYFMLEVGSMERRSATYDEPIHLLSGYAALAHGDFRIDPTHPPLVRMWAALPLLGMDNAALGRAKIDRTKPLAWMSDAYFYARDFLYKGRDADRTLNAARLMITLLGAGLGIMIFCWVREWLGFIPAVLALVCVLLEPNLGAHAGLVTTDTGLTCFYFGAIYFLWRTWRRWSLANAAGAVIFFSLACASKFSAVLLIPVGGILLILAVRRGAMSLRRAGGLAAAAGLVAFIAIWAVYGFRYAPSETPGWLFKIQDVPLSPQESPAVRPVLEWVDAHHMLPNAFTQGFLLCVTFSSDHPSYLAGDIRREGWWYYFPLAFFIKTPVPLLLLWCGGAFVLVSRRARLGIDNVAFLLIPAAVYFGLAMTTQINIGLRHILPVYPFVLLIAAVVFWEICRETWSARNKWLVVGSLLGFWVAMFARVYPYTLTFFNQLIGGARNGADYLVDSNLDWGQHLKELKTWMDERGISRINLAYFGMADPKYYGIEGVLLPGTGTVDRNQIAQPELPGYVAVSATVMSGVSFTPEWRLFYAGFKHLEPVTTIGNTIDVFWIEHWPEDEIAGGGQPNDEEIEQQYSLALGLTELGWHEHAVHHFQHYLRYRPGSSKGYAFMGHALARLGRNGEAAQALRRAVTFEPERSDYRGELVLVLIDLELLPEALKHARELVRLAPGNAHAHDMLGFTLGCLGRPAEALVEFERALKIAPADPVIRGHWDLARRLKAGESVK